MENNHNRNNTLKVIECKGFSDLFTLIDSWGKIECSKKSGLGEMNVDEVKKRIKNAWDLPSVYSLRGITRTNGLRAKVAELIVSNNYGADFPEIKGD